MAPATELATFPIASGAAVEDGDSAAGKVWQSTLDTVSQQDGFQRLYWGREVEDPSVLQLFVDWDSLDHHKRFRESATYGPFAKHLMTIVDGPLTMNHANLTPHPPTAAVGAAAPVTEVLTIYFEKVDDGFEGKWNEVVKACSDHAEGFKAGAGGWVVEDVEYEGKKRKAYVGLIGWESVEAHHAFRGTEAFKNNIRLLTEGTLGREVHHTEFVQK